MTCNQLSDRIRSWVWLYRNSAFPASTDPKMTNFSAADVQKMTKDMMTDVAHFEEPIELTWTAASDDLQAAVTLADSGNGTNLRKIHDLLLRVEKYIADNSLYIKNAGRS